MKILIREKLSPHKFKTPEGYLICQDAVLARTGKQTYRKNELFLDTDDDSEIEVDRPYDEVMSQETLASFENKPITIEHPDEDVTVDNYKDYAVGFVRDIRQSKVDGEDVIIGNLVITDKDAIEKVENGEMVELSCGYDCDIVGDESPKQTHIRGNHLALCEQGRAGIAKIIDSKVKDDWNGMIPSKKIIFNYHNGIWTITNYQTNKAVDVDERKYGSLTQEKAIDIAINQLHLNDSVKDSIQVKCPSMSLSEMKDYCDMYQCEVYNTGVKGIYRLEGKDAEEVKEELEADGYINDSIKDDFKKDMKSILKSKLSSMSTQYSVDEVYKAIMKLYNKKPYLTLDDCMNQVLNNIRNGNYLLDSIQDSQYRLKLEKKTNDYDEYVIACYKDGKYDEAGTYYTDDWDDAVGTMKDMSRRMGLNLRQQGRGYIADSIKARDDYSSFLGNYGFDYLKGNGDYETWYLKYDDEDFNKLVNRMRQEYPKMIVSSSPNEKTIYIQKSKYGVKDSIRDKDKVYKVNGHFVSANSIIDAVKKVKDASPMNIKARLVYYDNNGQKVRKEISHDQLEKLSIVNGRTEDYSKYGESGLAPRKELWNQPTLKGFLGPMYDGDAIRYESSRVYNELSI